MKPALELAPNCPPTATPGASPLSDIVQRVDASLDALEALNNLLGCDDPPVTAPVNYSVPQGFKVSIIVPVYNEAATIKRILRRIVAVPLPKEVVIVDDCSTDGTREILQELEQSPLLTVFYKPMNEGKGAALRTGFSLATGDVVVVQDADLEYDPNDIPNLVKPLIDNEADVVFGSRFLGSEPQDKSLAHRLGNRLLTGASNAFTGWRISDMETCYKVIRRSALQEITIRQNRFGFEPEITAKLARRRLRVKEVPITYHARSYAEGKKIGVKDLFNALYCIVRYGLAD